MSETEQKPQNSTESVNTAQIQQPVKKVPGVPFTKDDPRINRNGRPLGRENFSTIWWKFIDKVAKKNEITPDEVDEQLIAVAFKRMKEGDYRFWKDVRDRIHGQATQKQDLNVQGSLTISQVLDQLEHGRATGQQNLASESSVLDSGQAGATDSVSPEPSAEALPPEQVESQPNTQV